jgi:hypothetical protein
VPPDSADAGTELRLVQGCITDAQANERCRRRQPASELEHCANTGVRPEPRVVKLQEAATSTMTHLLVLRAVDSPLHVQQAFEAALQL